MRKPVNYINYITLYYLFEMFFSSHLALYLVFNIHLQVPFDLPLSVL